MVFTIPCFVGILGSGATLRLCFLRQTRACKHYKASLEKLAFFRELLHSPLADYSASEEDAYLPSPRVNAGFAAAVL